MLKAEKQRKRSLFSAFFVICLDNFGFGLVFIMFAPLLLNPSYHMLPTATNEAARNLLLGLLFASFPFTQAIGAPLFGDFADHFGRKKSLYWTIIGTTLGYIFSGVAILAKSYLWLLISRLMTGFFAGNLSLCLAIVADLSPDEKSRAKNYGFVTFLWGASWPISMLAGGYLSDPSFSKYFTPSLPFWLTTIFSVLSLIAIWKFYYETHPAQEKGRFDPIKGLHNIYEALKIKQMRPFFAVVLFWTIGWGISVQWYGAYSIERFSISQELISWGLILQGVFWTLGASFINPLLVKRLHSKSIALIGYVLGTVFLFLCSFSNQFPAFSLLYWISAIFAAFALSNSLNLVSLSAPEGIQGKAMGLGQSMMSFGWIFSPMLGGFLGKLEICLLYPAATLFFLIALVFLVSQKVRITR